MRIWLLAVPLAVGLVTAVIAAHAREGDTAFVADQRHLHQLTPAAVDRALQTAPNPKTRRSVAGARATCTPQGNGQLRNPWNCRIRYPGGLTVRYLITVASNGSFGGPRKDDVGRLQGCCVTVSGTS